MSETAEGESKVSGNQANIPAHIRRRFDIEDGDILRWVLEDDGLRVEVVNREAGTFADVDGYEGEEQTEATQDHDAWGV